MSTWATSKARIIDVQSLDGKCKHCKRKDSAVLVTIQRADGTTAQYESHDDGSFIEWLGESNSSA